MAKILLVEDEINIASFIERGLQEFGHEVCVANDGQAGWELVQQEDFQLLILDIIMPKMNGLQLCKQYRQTYGYQSPVIMLTALGTTDDIVNGLDAGADDYLVKPFSFQELEARIKALLRRTGAEPAVPLLSCGDLTLDPSSHRAIRGKVVIDLTVKEYRLLEYLHRRIFEHCAPRREISAERAADRCRGETQREYAKRRRRAYVAEPQFCYQLRAEPYGGEHHAPDRQPVERAPPHYPCSLTGIFSGIFDCEPRRCERQTRKRKCQRHRVYIRDERKKSYSRRAQPPGQIYIERNADRAHEKRCRGERQRVYEKPFRVLHFCLRRSQKALNLLTKTLLNVII